MANVLLVEDDANFIQALETTLVLAGHGVRMAESGAEALNVASLYLPDIVVTDVVMPVMDGIRLVRALKASSSFASIPIILMTAINVPQNLPVHAFLRKPFPAMELVDLITEILQ